MRESTVAERVRGQNYTSTRRPGRWKSSVKEKVRWLRSAEQYWKGVPYSRDLQKRLVLAMKIDGLIAPSTYYRDVQIEALIKLTLESK